MNTPEENDNQDSRRHQALEFSSMYRSLQPEGEVQMEDHEERPARLRAENARRNDYHSVVIPYSDEDEPPESIPWMKTNIRPTVVNSTNHETIANLQTIHKNMDQENLKANGAAAGQSAIT
ncbi:hypothetical protein R1flu_017952 [Riccia fluitans]|uniref:Uncharacterized protein n=1 Tax=Riccia fluitans TaxID=41844 RepID=A0ABD1ZHU4_9MARC